ncbi:MAG: hypothetical protein JXQ93_02430 [Flavobacteriaceae bacterium]
MSPRAQSRGYIRRKTNKVVLDCARTDIANYNIFKKKTIINGKERIFEE